MRTFSELIGKEPNKKQINAALKKAGEDLKLDREKYLDHVAMNKAAQLSNKQTVMK
ncbi:MAG TPA: hypothetical protein VL443_29970 [Cyclobacteriaceae bacterium]|jgi:hypothetical protein|nr:hypothetical protein [Cyclobacteriaceae bacterium]